MKKGKRANLYAVFALIGAVLVAVLILMQITFKEYMEFKSNGYAIQSGTVAEYLGMEPQADTVEQSIPLCAFDALETLFEQGERLFLGEEKKTQIDSDFPVYLNKGASLQLVNDSATLITPDFEDVETYMGLIVTNGYTYNINGERADAGQFIFLKLANGNYSNLEKITYEKKGRQFSIPENSFLRFSTEYIVYYAYENGQLQYHILDGMSMDFVLNVNGTDYTYEELLIALGIGMPSYAEPERPEEEPTEIVEEPDTEIVIEELPKEEGTATGTEPIVSEDDEETVIDRRPTGDIVTPPTTPSTPTNKNNGIKNPGVRPDSMKPDKGEKDPDDKEKVEEYVKPTVTVSDFTGAVYRLTAEMTVDDPAQRIDRSKQVQFLVYKVDEKGKERLLMRSYSMRTGTVELGGGVVEPEANYHVVAFFTYANEYNETVQEDIGEWTVSTREFASLEPIALTHQAGTPNSNFFQIENFGYDTDNSDAEAIYGIDAQNGITIEVKEKASSNVITNISLTGSEISRFKKHTMLTLSTGYCLQPKTAYVYTIRAVDYFGNELTLTNDTGEAMTSKNMPVAKMNLAINEIKNFKMTLSVTDEDYSAVPKSGESDEYDIYVVISTANKTYESAEQMEEAKETGEVAFSYKLESDEYSVKDGQLVVEDVPIATETLKIGTSYYATAYCDYDLDNNAGVHRFASIGQMNFKTQDFSKLGKVYIKAGITDIKYDKVTITLSLDGRMTNSQLADLVDEVSVEIWTKDENPTRITEFGFDPDTTTQEEDGKPLSEIFQNGGPIVYGNIDLTMDGTFESSATEYELRVSAYANLEEDERVELTSQISPNTFKTLKKPAEVQISNLVFAAGILQLDVFVDDPDDTIIGNSGDKVVVYLYTNSGTFVKAGRITKNTPQTLTYTDLDPTVIYELRFIAVEYNEGYTNEMFESNKLLWSESVKNSLSLTGTIKLMNLDATGTDGLFVAETKVSLSDTGYELTGNSLPYQIRIEKNGEVVSDSKYILGDRIKDGTATQPDKAHDYLYKVKHKDNVDQGDFTYKYTLYVTLSNKEIVLDTLSFTSEDTIRGFSTAYQMITFINENPSGRYVAQNDIVMNVSNAGSSYYDYYNYREPLAPNEEFDPKKNDRVRGYISYFYGELDFQGFTMETHYYNMANYTALFAWLSGGATIGNMQMEVYFDNTGAFYFMGGLTYRNEGTIHDVIVNFRGGSVFANQRTSLLAYNNGASGIIENFVIQNAPTKEETNRMNYTVQQYSGMAVCYNYGVVRYGYVYGEPIYCPDVPSAYDRRVGGLVGHNCSIGKIYSVYSLVYIEQPEVTSISNPNHNSFGYRYGTVCGHSDGSVKNAYSTKDNVPYEEKNIGSGNFLGWQTSPIIGTGNGTKYNKVYYYSPDGHTYSGKQSLPMSLDNLYDTGWQTMILTGRFDVAPVEVGYYPQILLSEELPAQEYLPLPAREASGDMAVSQANVQSYKEGAATEPDSAIVKFVFYNPNRYTITSVEIENLTATLDLSSTTFADGYTTIMGEVSDPQSFRSTYDIQSVTYVASGKRTTYKLPKPYTLSADFYRKISTPDEWYTYVVQNAAKGTCENIKIAKDIDFTGVAADRIRVTGSYTSKLVGMKKSDGTYTALKNIDLQSGFKAANNTTVWNLFSNGTSLSGSGEMSDLYIENYKAGGISTNKGVTYVAKNAAIFHTVQGTVSNVHVRGEDIVSYDRMGGITANLTNGGELLDCTVVGLDVTYKEPDNAATTVTFGGCAGYMTESRLNHCLVRDISVEALELSGSSGVGGVVGSAVNAVIDTAYAMGSITTRATQVGGVIGSYVSSGDSIIGLKNVYADVDITTYTDVAGGIIGMLNVPASTNARARTVTGVAFGNVYCFNPDGGNVGHAVGQVPGGQITLYGFEKQILNGQLDSSDVSQEVATKLLSVADVSENAVTTYRKVIGFDNGYQYNTDGTLPKMYYEDGSALLPGQEDISITKDETGIIAVDKIDVTSWQAKNIVVIQLYNPKHYRIDKLTSQLKFQYVTMEGNDWVGVSDLSELSEEKYKDYVDDSVGDYTRIFIQYEKDLNGYEHKQDYYLDSYILSEIHYCDAAGTAQTIQTNARIGVTLYCMIQTVDNWNRYLRRVGHDYENYELAGGLDFSGQSISSTDVKIGRLYANPTRPAQERTIKNISLTDCVLIARLNSSLENIIFEDITIALDPKGLSREECTYLMNNVGIIGSSSGSITGCTFKNITVTPFTSYDSKLFVRYVGIVGYQNGGTLSDVTLENVYVNAKANKINNGTVTEIGYYRSQIEHTGGLCGYISGASDILDITGTGVYVGGGNYAGGLAGYVYLGNIKGVEYENVMVDSGGSYIGGLIGQLGTGSASQVAYVNNVSVKGNLTWNDNTKTPVSGQTSKVRGGAYAGGCFGRCYERIGGNNYSYDEENSATLVVDGMWVYGKFNYIGGIMGYGYQSMYHMTIKNSVVQSYYNSEKKDNTSYNYMGGIAGFIDAHSGYLTVDNCFVAANMISQVGGAIGCQNGGNINFISVRNSLVKVESNANRISRDMYVGGVIGYAPWVHIYYSGAVNTPVYAPYSTSVGGFAGKFTTGITQGYLMRSCYYRADPATHAATGYEAVADENKGKVTGYQYVGGLVGFQAGGLIHFSYSNARVEANQSWTNGGHQGTACGGISGYYANNTSGAGNLKSYSCARIYDCYFAGTVKGNCYSGGLIGVTGLKWNNKDASASRSKQEGTGSADEISYTYNNIILAAKIDGASNKAHSICGHDKNFVGRNSRIWDGTYINSQYAGALYNGKTVSNYTIGYWSPQLNQNYYANKALLFTSDDIMTGQNSGATGDKIGVTVNNWNSPNWGYPESGPETGKYKTFPANVVFFRYMGSGWNISIGNNRETWWRIHVNSASGLTAVTTRYSSKYETSKVDGPGEYLPQPRSATSRMYHQDLCILQQNGGKDTVSGLLPVPTDKYEKPTTYATLSMRTPVNTYADVYAADVDTLNVEFSSDLTSGGYFELFVGNESVTGIVPITKRVYSYPYDFSKDVRLEYGWFDEEEECDPIDAVRYAIGDLRRAIMVYADDYAYINEDGAVVTGKDGEHSLQEDEVFVHLMNGKAIDSSGNVWSTDDWMKLSSVAGAMEELDEPVPMYLFDYMGSEIVTYAHFSEIVTDGITVSRESQIFICNNELYTVDGVLENVKDAVLLYHLNGVSYQTILGIDGIAVDMRQDDVNMPQDVPNAAIAQMTNTIYADVPYVLLEYSNGGMIGYNYATGEILFDNRKTNNISLMEYVRTYFSGAKKSVYAGLNDTYEVNHSVADSVQSTNELEKLAGYTAPTDGVSSEGLPSAIGDSSNSAVTDSDNIGSVDADNIGTKNDENTESFNNPNSVEGEKNDNTVEKPDGEDYDSDDESTGDSVTGTTGNGNGAAGDVNGTDAENEDGDADEEDADDKNEDGDADKEDVDDKNEDGDADKEDADDKNEDGDADKKDADEENEDGDADKEDADDKNEDGDADKEDADEESEDGNADNEDADVNGEGTGDTPQEGTTKQTFMAVYNSETGSYELVVIERYLTDNTYQSENARLGIEQLAQVVSGGAASGYADATVDNSQQNGVRIYIAAIALIAVIGAGVLLILRKKSKNK